MVFLTSHLSGFRRTFALHPQTSSGRLVTCTELLDVLLEKEGSCQDVYLSFKGKPISEEDSFEGNDNVVASLQLRGGKGGFGSMLRAIGAQIEKTTNREACRDLSGRRLRDINEEKRLKDFLAKKVEKEKELLEIKRKKLKQLQEGPRHIFEDKSYFEQREKREQDIYESLDKAFATSIEGEPSTSKVGDCQIPKKNLKKRLMDDLDESSEEDSDEDSASSKSGADEPPKEEEEETDAEEQKSDEAVGEKAGIAATKGILTTPLTDVGGEPKKPQSDEDDKKPVTRGEGGADEADDASEQQKCKRIRTH